MLSELMCPVDKISAIYLLSFIVALSGLRPPAAAQGPLFQASNARRLPVGSLPTSVALVELNGDMKLDIVVANQGSDDVTILLGDGLGGFKQAAGSPFPAGPNPDDIAIGDFDGDSRLDLAFPNHETRHVTLLLGNGRGGFAPAPASPLSVTTHPHAHTIASGDLDGDHVLDLVVDDWQESKITLLFGSGNAMFRTPGTPVPVSPIPYQNIRVADLNGDGKLDIVTPARRRDAVTVLLGDGEGGFGQAEGSPFAAGRSPFYVGVGDLNGDRVLDLAVANYSGNMNNPDDDGVTVLQGDGSGSYGPTAGSPFAAGRAPVRLALGDVDGDGINDIAVANLGSDDVTLLLGGKTGMRPAPGSPLAAGNSPYSVALGDLNGDDKADLVVANYHDDDVRILLAQ